MNLFEMVVKEYITIVGFLEENNEVENNRIIVEKGNFRALLEKYAYLTFKEKTKIYKQLNFIIHDKNNYTMPCKDKNTKKTIRKVVICYDTYQIIKKLYEVSV